jgi:hypothetical protein
MHSLKKLISESKIKSVKEWLLHTKIYLVQRMLRRDEPASLDIKNNDTCVIVINNL